MKKIAFVFITLMFSTVTMTDANSKLPYEEETQAWLKLSNKKICGCYYDGTFYTSPDNLVSVRDGQEPTKYISNCGNRWALLNASSIWVQFSNNTIKEKMRSYEGQPICVKGSTSRFGNNRTMYDPRFLYYPDGD